MKTVYLLIIILFMATLTDEYKAKTRKMQCSFLIILPYLIETTRKKTDRNFEAKTSL